MKVWVPCDYEGTYSLVFKKERERSPYGPIEITEDEYFAFQKCEIEFYEWQDKISKLLEMKNAKPL